jgi:hypothetical protein
MKITVSVLQQMKRDGRKITAVLAADFRSLEIIEAVTGINTGWLCRRS